MLQDTYVGAIERVGEEDTVTSGGGSVGLVRSDELRAVKVVLDRKKRDGSGEDSRVLWDIIRL